MSKLVWYKHSSLLRTFVNFFVTLALLACTIKIFTDEINSVGRLLIVTNTLAYFVAPSVMKEKRFNNTWSLSIYFRVNVLTIL